MGVLVPAAAAICFGALWFSCFRVEPDGTVFKLDTMGRETVLYGFTGGADGAFPLAGLIREAAGNL